MAGFGGTGGFSFNSNTGGGGFGNNTFGTNTGTTGGFGSTTQGTSGGFGTTTSAGSGFGGFGTSGGTSGGLFSNNKPATNTFGTGTTTGGNMFGGNTQNTNTAFGSSTSNAFGSTQATPFGGNTSTTNSPFGGGSFNTNPTNNTAFGANKSTGLFGQVGAGTTTFGTTGVTNAFGSGAGMGAVPECQGTKDPFQPFTEKETNGTTNLYQTITFMQQYQKYSLEELRLADYNQGRQYGNGGGQAGAFGSTNFGGGFNTNTNATSSFGTNNNTTATGGGLFSNNTTTANAFATNTATTGPFGNSGGLFGQTKPATGGLFGQTATTAATSTPSLFGATPAANTGFGTPNNNQQTNTAFGTNNQAKPSLFGQTNATTTGAFGLGNTQTNTTPSGGLFGNPATTSATGGLFTNNTQQQGTGLFGNTQNNNTGGIFGQKPAASTTFGTPAASSTSGGLFGGPQQNQTGGTGLFGATNNQQQQAGGLFGNNNNNQQQQPQSSGLFGNANQTKPLFGNAASTNTGGGLFGNNTQQQQQTGGLFGNQQPASTQNNALGGGLFNLGNNQAKPGGLFTTNQPNNNLGGSLFSGGNSILGQQQNNQQQQPMLGQQEVKHASLLDPNPYAQSSIWTSLPQPTAENSKPLFTPLTATKKLEESARKPLPTLKLSHARYMTPPRRTGFGLSYSTYGTPSSVTSTPGGAPLSGSVYGGRGWTGGSFGRSFNRSASVQNLRSQYSDADDIWKPNAFAPSHRNSGGSIKRLTIDRSLHSNLFNLPQATATLPTSRQPAAIENTLESATETNGAQGRRSSQKSVTFEDARPAPLTADTGALQRTESDDEETPRRRNGDLEAVPEDRAANAVSSHSPDAKSINDPQPGEYWSKPNMQELRKMDRSALRDFVVGREGCGYVHFDQAVNLTGLDLDNLFGNIIDIIVRSVTVYPDATLKPAIGNGLNVPSTITIENSWPRAKGKPVADTSGPIIDKHVERLKRMKGTEFVKYNVQTGQWIFKVPHYTRYGLDYDDADTTMDQSEPSLPPHSFEKSTDSSVMEVDEASDEDTFDFKKSVPGQFGKRSIIPSDDELEYNSSPQHPDDSGSEHSAYSEDEVMSEEEQSPSMPGSLPSSAKHLQPDVINTPTKTKLLFPGTPGRPLLDLEGDWAEQLQKTISPRKQNRDVLREEQSKILLDKAFSPIKPKTASAAPITSTLDIMNSIFKNSTRRSHKAPEPDFELPYSKRSKTFHSDDAKMTDQDRIWHSTFKPHFTTSGEIMYKTSKFAKAEDWKEISVAEDKTAIIAIGRQQSTKPYDLESSLASSQFDIVSGIPTVKHDPVIFSQLAGAKDKDITKIYGLAHVLFDEYDDEFTRGLNGSLKVKFAHRIRRDRLVKFLADRILSTLGADLSSIEKISPSKGALLRLTAHDVAGARSLLTRDRNIRLGLLVAQLGGADRDFMSDVKHQLDAWREQKTLSEVDYDIRAIYEICSGNVGISQGFQGKSVAVEDRAESFSISTQFGLGWLQCFMLGLLYGRAEKDNKDGVAKIEDAVREYEGRCDRGEESVKPADDDVMWPLLKLYASKFDKTVSAPEFPAAIEGLKRQWDHSALFDFYNSIHATVPVSANTDVADSLAETLASELSAKNDLASAIYALSHISKPMVRKSLIQDLLDRFAANLPGSDTATSDGGIALWQRLSIDLKVPTSWIYMSKARYAASETNNGGDNVSELRYLIAAEAWEDAHDCLLKRVAPGFVVDQDYESLLEMCSLFGTGEDPIRRVSSWHNNGAIFASFGRLMTGEIAKTDTAEIAALRKRLVVLGQKTGRDGNGVPRHVELGQLNQHELEEHVCIKEMANAIARLGFAGAEVGSAREVLELPLTQDMRLEILTREGMPREMSLVNEADSAPKKPNVSTRKRNQNKGLGVRGTSTPLNGDTVSEDNETNA